MNLRPEIVSLPGRAFAGLEAGFIPAFSPNANNMEVIPRLWAAFDARATDAKGLEPGVTYGLSRCEAENPTQPPESAVYLAAVEIGKDAAVPRGFVKWTTPAGTFAKFIHRGPIADIGKTVGYIHGQWLPRSGYTRASGPDVERYDERFDPASDTSVMEIYVPVERAT